MRNMDEQQAWFRQNRKPGDHIGVETVSLRLFGTFEKLTPTKLTMTLDTGEVLDLRFSDVLNVDDAWPK